MQDGFLLPFLFCLPFALLVFLGPDFLFLLHSVSSMGQGYFHLIHSIFLMFQHLFFHSLPLLPFSSGLYQAFLLHSTLLMG